MNKPPNMPWDTMGPIRPERPAARGESPLRPVRSNPLLAGFLDAAATAGVPVLVLVNDSHRATQTRATLGALAEAVGRRRERPRFEALFATGTHGSSAAEREQFEHDTLHDCGVAFDRVDWHASTDDASHGSLDNIRIDRRVLERTWLLAIGSLEPHYFAGVTGAHKTLTIGVLHRDEIERNHAGALDPRSDVLALEGNPVYDGIVAILQKLAAAGKRICTINQVECAGQILEVAVGDPLATLRKLLPTVRRTFVQTIDHPYDVIVLDVPPPLGMSLYQADKALKNNHRAVRDGGGIVLIADCPNGIGPDAFYGLLRRAETYDAAVQAVKANGYRLGDHKAVKLRHLTDPAARGVRVALVSKGIREEDARVAGLRLFDDREQAMAWLRSSTSGSCERGLQINDAGNVSIAVAG